jgi:hypothetical protein
MPNKNTEREFLEGCWALKNKRVDCDTKKTPWLESASELYRPTERPPLVGEVSTNFSG